MSAPKTRTVELSEIEVAAILLVVEDSHQQMLRMVETHGRDNPIWQKYCDAWESISRKLTPPE